MCEQFVKGRLRAPKTAEFARMSESQVQEGDLPGEYFVRSHVDAQNAFGALIRNPYDCVVQDTCGGNYKLTALKMD